MCVSHLYRKQYLSLTRPPLELCCGTPSLMPTHSFFFLLCFFFVVFPFRSFFFFLSFLFCSLLDSASAPRRLFFSPALQTFAHTYIHTQATRRGSYFSFRVLCTSSLSLSPSLSHANVSVSVGASCVSFLEYGCFYTRTRREKRSACAIQCCFKEGLVKTTAATTKNKITFWLFFCFALIQKLYGKEYILTLHQLSHCTHCQGPCFLVLLCFVLLL